VLSSALALTRAFIAEKTHQSGTNCELSDLLASLS
jgi:hypothetical protein